MAIEWTRRTLLLCALVCGFGTPLRAEPRDAEYGQAIRRAVAVLPRRPVQVLVIDVNDARPADREHLSKLQAFVIKGRQVVYLTKHGEALRGAVNGSRFCEYVLATVIWHEMVHAEGGDENEARRREVDLWTRFILDSVVDRGAALRYLGALKQRPAEGIL